jgi:hypothetical protein
MLDVMDDLSREPRTAQQSPATASGETPESTTAAHGTGRLLANPRRVRRA